MELAGVSATTLWTLRNRAVEAKRPDRVIEDPWAVRLYETITYDYDQFGPASQSHPLRALAIDAAMRDYLARRPHATVVALGEGLQTGYWRLGRPEVDWLSVDLAPVIEVRERLLPAEKRVTALRISALDRTWLDHVDPAGGVFISAEGLFMYFQPAEVLALIEECAQRFPGGRLIFDSIPAWFRDRTLRGLRLSDRYTTPPMPFSCTVTQAARLPRRIAAVESVTDVRLPRGRGLWKLTALRALFDLPYLREQRPSLTLLDFAPRT